MKVLAPKYLKVLTIAGLIFLVFPVVQWLLWLYAFDHGSTYEERIALYMKYVPDFIGRSGSVFFGSIAAFFAVICGVLSLVLSVEREYWKIIIANILILIISIFLIFLNLFTMM